MYDVSHGKSTSFITKISTKWYFISLMRTISQKNINAKVVNIINNSVQPCLTNLISWLTLSLRSWGYQKQTDKCSRSFIQQRCFGYLTLNKVVTKIPFFEKIIIMIVFTHYASFQVSSVEIWTKITEMPSDGQILKSLWLWISGTWYLCTQATACMISASNRSIQSGLKLKRETKKSFDFITIFLHDLFNC